MASSLESSSALSSPRIPSAPMRGSVFVFGEDSQRPHSMKAILEASFDVIPVNDVERLSAIINDLHPAAPSIFLIDESALSNGCVKGLRGHPSTARLPVIAVFENDACGYSYICDRVSQYSVDDFIVKTSSRELIAWRLHRELKLLQAREEAREEQMKNTAMRENDALFTRLSPVALLRLDLNHRVVYFNQKAHDLLGASVNFECENLQWKTYIHSSDAERIHSVWDSAVKSHQDHWKSEYRLKRPDDNNSVWILSEAVAERNEFGQIVGYIETLLDETDLKKSQEEKNESCGQIAAQAATLLQVQIHRSKVAQFIDTLCHELRNPAQGMLGVLQLLEALVPLLESALFAAKASNLGLDIIHSSACGIVELKECLTSFKQCLDFQKRLLDDMLMVSKFEEGNVALDLVSVDLPRVIPNACNLFFAEVKRKNLQMEVQPLELFHQMKLPLVRADLDRLSQVMANILSNAIRFSKESGKIIISSKILEQDQAMVVFEVTVTDVGIGMTTEEISGTFDRYYQSGLKTTTEYGGSGLGLLVSKLLVGLMGGRMVVESEKGKGTRVTFEAIFETFLGKRETVNTVTDVTTQSPRCSVLVVEDNLINQKLMVKILEKEGIKCQVASTGEEAVNLITKQMSGIANIPHIDVVLMDIEMPTMNGLLATQIIREKEKQMNRRNSIPIIGVSGYSSEEFQQRASDVGMDDYVTKPYEKLALISRIRKVCEQRIKCQTSM